MRRSPSSFEDWGTSSDRQTVNTVNAILTAISEVILAPMKPWPLTALIVLSVVTGVAMTLGFRYTSNQTGLRRVADRAKAQLLCMRIFKDDLGVALGCQLDLLKAIGLRLWYSVPPMLVFIVPFVLILTQLALRYENRPLHRGESVIASIELAADQWKEHNDVRIQVPAGVTVETPPLRDEREHAVYWRLRLDEPTDGTLRWTVGYHVVEKTFLGTDDDDRLCTVSVRRPGDGFWDRLLRPGEAGFDADSPVRGVDVRYPRRSTPIFGINVPWWATFLIVSMGTALIVRPFLKVQF